MDNQNLDIISETIFMTLFQTFFLKEKHSMEDMTNIAFWRPLPKHYQFCQEEKEGREAGEAELVELRQW